MTKIKLECEIDQMKYISLLSATVTQNVIILSNCMFKEAHPWLLDYIMLFVTKGKYLLYSTLSKVLPPHLT